MGTELYIDIMGAQELLKFMERSVPGLVLETADEVLEEFADKAVEDAKKKFGVYQPASLGEGESFAPWEQLKPRTIAQKKVRPGQNVPLLDSGDLQGSVEKLSVSETVKMVGTYDPNGARSEYGTAKAPARPWLRPTLFELKMPFATKLRERLVEVLRAKFNRLKS